MNPVRILARRIREWSILRRLKKCEEELDRIDLQLQLQHVRQRTSRSARSDHR